MSSVSFEQSIPTTEQTEKQVIEELRLDTGITENIRRALHALCAKGTEIRNTVSKKTSDAIYYTSYDIADRIDAVVCAVDNILEFFRTAPPPTEPWED